MKRVLALVLLLASGIGLAEPIPTESGPLEGIVLPSGVRAARSGFPSPSKSRTPRRLSKAPQPNSPIRATGR